MTAPKTPTQLERRTGLERKNTRLCNQKKVQLKDWKDEKMTKIISLILLVFVGNVVSGKGEIWKGYFRAEKMTFSVQFLIEYMLGRRFHGTGYDENARQFSASHHPGYLQEWNSCVCVVLCYHNGDATWRSIGTGKDDGEKIRGTAKVAATYL